MSYGKDTSRTGEYNPTQRDPRLQGQGQTQGQWDQPSTTEGYQDPSYTRDTGGHGLGAETTQGRSTGEPGYGDRTTAQQHHVSRTDEPMRDTTALGRDSGIRGTGPGVSSTTAGTYPGEYGMEGQHFRHGESMAPLSTVPGTTLPATVGVGGDIHRHEGPITRHEERKEGRREQELERKLGEGPLERREEHRGQHHEGPLERREEHKELRGEEELGRGGMSRREAHRVSVDEPCMTNVPGTKFGGWEETRGGGLPKQQAHTTTTPPGAGVTGGGTAYAETGAQSGRGIHAQQYERHPEQHLGERERQHLTAEERLAAERPAEGGYTGRQGGEERQNLEAQQAARAGTGGVGAQGVGDTQRTGAGYGDTQRTGAGYGDTQRTGAGYGDTQRTGEGYGDTQRTGAGYGDTQRTGAGYGDTQRTGAGYGDTQHAGAGYGDTQRAGAGYGDTQRAGAGYGDTQRAGAGVGYGDAQRAGDTGYGVGPTGAGAYRADTTGTGKVSMTDKVIGGGEKLAGKVTSNTELYEQGTQRQRGVYEPHPRQ